jgi:hypothetical protein
MFTLQGKSEFGEDWWLRGQVIRVGNEAKQTSCFPETTAQSYRYTMVHCRATRTIRLTCTEPNLMNSFFMTAFP